MSDSENPARGAVVKPEFVTRIGDFSAGSAFPLFVPTLDQAWLVSCLHLFGPAGGLPEWIAGSALSQLVVEVRLRDPFDGELLGTAGQAWSSEFWDGQDPQRDLCAFVPDEDAVPRLVLETTMPEQGAPVALLGKVRAGADPDQRLHHARVIESDEDDLLRVRFDEAELDLGGTSGAPILAADGHVVGMLVRFEQRPGELHGICLSSEAMERLLLGATDPTLAALLSDNGDGDDQSVESEPPAEQFRKRALMSFVGAIDDMKEERFWALTEDLGWGADPKIDDVAAKLATRLSLEELEAAHNTALALASRLRSAIEKWERKSGQSLPVGDDRFSDLCDHILGLGRQAFQSALDDPSSLLARAKNRDYRESFMSCFAHAEARYGDQDVKALLERTSEVVDWSGPEAATDDQLVRHPDHGLGFEQKKSWEDEIVIVFENAELRFPKASC